MSYNNQRKVVIYLVIFSVAKGIVPSTPSDYTPVINKTVTYIVMAVIINNEGDVLMIQEAKSSCAGQWYLPAGRIDPGENIEVRIAVPLLLTDILFYLHSQWYKIS